MNKLIIATVAIVLFTSCNLEEDKIKDTSLLKYELENRKLKKINEADILTAALTKGNEIVKRTGDSLKFHLMAAVERGGVPEAIQYCNINAIPLTSKLSKQANAQISRISLSNRNQVNAPKTELEKQLLAAYQYNIENRLELTPSIQILDSTILYTNPIVVGEFCLKCHGIEDEHITKENVALLKKLYPNGKAMGYKAGELRGMWSVSFNKKEFIKNM